MGTQNISTPEKRKTPVILTEAATPTGFSQSTWRENAEAPAQSQKNNTNHHQIQELATLRDWLLPMLMNGQVRVG